MLVEPGGEKWDMGNTYRKHLIGLVKNKHLHTIGLQESSLDHVVDTTRSADDNLGTFLKGLHALADASSANASMAFNAHEIADGDNDLLNLLSQLTSGRQDECLALLDIRVDLLENGNREGRGLASTGLGLRNDIVAYRGVNILRRSYFRRNRLMETYP